MARPSKNAEGPSATERMQAAFWSCLAEMPYESISVRDIVERADVNRNSYYYHYNNMAELATASMRDSVVLELARALIESGDTETRFSDDAQGDGRLVRLRMLSNSATSQDLANVMKDVIVGEWLSIHGLRKVDLSEDARIAIDFVYGGIAELWACERFESIIDVLSAIATSSLITQNIGALRQELARCAEQARAAREAAMHVEAADPDMQISLF